MPSGRFKVFYSYSHADRRMLDRLRAHLSMLRRHGLITEWYDRDIDAGAAWREEIGRELNTADVIMLLISADFLASDFCYEQEMLRAIERAERGETTVISVMLRPVDDWERTPFAKFQVVPSYARPISKWPNVDEAYVDVAASVRNVLEERARSASPAVAETRITPPEARDLSSDSETASRLHELSVALSELVEQSSVDEYIIVTGDPEAIYFTQCFTEGGAFWCECVSNEFLDAAHTLTTTQVSNLAKFGWNPPGHDLPNWWCIVGDQEDVGALFVRTLAEVYGVELSAPLQIERSWAARRLPSRG